jgi:hypothetical protein
LKKEKGKYNEKEMERKIKEKNMKKIKKGEKMKIE